MADVDLLSRVAQEQDRDAFAQLVQQYIALVYGCAARQVGAANADDLTQNVFGLLWQKAGSINELSNLPGWLVKTTQLSAMQWRRGEMRRRRREMVAATHRNESHEVAMDISSDELSPVLDAALAQLSDSERSAVVMRYLQDQTVEQVARNIGISVDAASKRLSRGILHLRELLKRQHGDLSTDSLARSLLAIGAVAPVPPAYLGAKIIGVAVAKKAAVSFVSAKAFNGAVLVHKLMAVVGAVLLSSTLLAGTWAVWKSSSSIAVAAQLANTQPATPAPVVGLIKVGVTLSKLTADTKSPGGKPWGYDGQMRIVGWVASADFDLYPVIEPGTANDPDVKAQLAKLFPGKDPIDGGDTEALKKLNVLVSNDEWMLPRPMLVAVEKAVRDGLNLLNIGGMGWASPGIHSSYPPPASQPAGAQHLAATSPDDFDSKFHTAHHLTGMTDSAGGFTNAPLVCKVIKNHAILASFAPTGQIDLSPLGMFGILPPDATPLVQAVDSSTIQTRGPHGDTSKFIFYPVFLSHLEKGKIVGIGFSPSKLRGAQQRQDLLQRSILWLAGRLHKNADGDEGL